MFRWLSASRKRIGTGPVNHSRTTELHLRTEEVDVSQGDKIESKQKDAAARDRPPEGFVPSIPRPPLPYFGLALELLPEAYPIRVTSLHGESNHEWIAYIRSVLTPAEANQLAEWCDAFQVRVLITFAPDVSPDDEYAKQDASDCCTEDINAILSTAVGFDFYRYTTERKGKVALTILSWDLDPVEFLQSQWTILETWLNDIRQRIGEVQKEREEIDARRDQWVQEKAIPLLDDMMRLWESATLPPAESSELNGHRQKLVQDISHPAPWITETIATLTGDVPTPEDAKPATPESLIDEPTPSGMIAALARLNTRLDAVSGEAKAVVQSFLDELVEATAKNEELFPTLDEKKKFAKGLQAILDRTALTILTSKNVPGRFDAYHSGGTKEGGFRLRWSASNDESLSLPFRRLVVGPKPLRRPKSLPKGG